MSKINVDQILKAFPLQSTEATDPGLRVHSKPAPKAKDEYIPSEPTTGWQRTFWGKRKDLKEAQEILAKIEWIPRSPEEAARRYFDVDLSRLLALGQRQPVEVKRLLQRSLESSPNKAQVALWYHLVEAAQGDTRPLFRTFEQEDLKMRLALFRITLFSPHVGDGHLIGELFVKLMRSTTQEEKEKWVEPTLNSILNRGAWSTHPKVQNKLAWLKAFYHGWLEEANELA